MFFMRLSLFFLSFFECVFAWNLSLPRMKNIAILKMLSSPPRGFDPLKYNHNTTVATSMIPPPNKVADQLHVKHLQKAPAWVWKVAWRGHAKLLPLLHFRDACFSNKKVQDSSYALQVLWCKAIASSCDRSSPAYDAEQWILDLLPKWSTAIVVRIFGRLWPRLHHANIELRMVYLQQALQEEVKQFTSHTQTQNTSCVRLVVLGAGYDVIATRLLNQGVVQEAYELDLPQVVQRKQLLLDRLQKRRRIRNERQTAGNNHEVKLPQLVGVDFNDISSLRKELQLIGSSIADREYTNVHTIFWSEGVMIYLNATIPGQLLQACADSVDNNSASLIFADRLENVPGGDLSLAKQELLSNQWELIDWCPKPGLARHMGRARLVHVR